MGIASAASGVLGAGRKYTNARMNASTTSARIPEAVVVVVVGLRILLCEVLQERLDTRLVLVPLCVRVRG